MGLALRIVLFSFIPQAFSIFIDIIALNAIFEINLSAFKDQRSIVTFHVASVINRILLKTKKKKSVCFISFYKIYKRDFMATLD